MSFSFCLSFIDLFSVQLSNTTAEVHETLETVADWVAKDLLQHGLRLVSDLVRQITAGAIFHRETTPLGVLFFEMVFRKLDKRESMLASSFRREVGRLAVHCFMESWNRDPAHVHTVTAYFFALANRRYISRRQIYALIEGTAADEIRKIYASQFKGGDLLYIPYPKMCRILGRPAFCIQQLVEDANFFIRSILYEGEHGTSCSPRGHARLSTRVVADTERLIASHWDSMKMTESEWENISVPEKKETEASFSTHRRPSIAQSSQIADPDRPLLNYKKDRVPFSAVRSAAAKPAPKYFQENSQMQSSLYSSFVPNTASGTGDGRSPTRISDLALKSPEIQSLWKLPSPCQ